MIDPLYDPPEDSRLTIQSGALLARIKEGPHHARLEQLAREVHESTTTTADIVQLHHVPDTEAGTIEWLYRSLVEGLKGAGGVDSSFEGVLLNDAVTRLLARQKYVFWTPPEGTVTRYSEQLREARYLAQEAPAISAFAELVAEASRAAISYFLGSQQNILLHRKVALTAPIPLPRISRTRPTFSDHAVAQVKASHRFRALNAFTSDLEFAREWKRGGRFNRVVLSARVPASCIWFLPGYGEGEVVVSPIGMDGAAIELEHVESAP